MRVRRVAADVTWAFAKGTPAERNLCIKCQVINGRNCPRKKLRTEHKSMIAVQCIFFREQP